MWARRASICLCVWLFSKMLSHFCVKAFVDVLRCPGPVNWGRAWPVGFHSKSLSVSPCLSPSLFSLSTHTHPLCVCVVCLILFLFFLTFSFPALLSLFLSSCAAAPLFPALLGQRVGGAEGVRRVLHERFLGHVTRGAPDQTLIALHQPHQRPLALGKPP